MSVLARRFPDLAETLGEGIVGLETDFSEAGYGIGLLVGDSSEEK